MKDFDRMLRVNELLRRELGMLCERELAERFHCLVTITKVETSSDLRNANVSVSIMAGNEAAQKEALGILQRAHARLQADLAANVKLKYTPVLRFKLDNSLTGADRVFSILRELDMAEEPALPEPETPVADDGGDDA